MSLGWSANHWNCNLVMVEMHERSRNQSEHIDPREWEQQWRQKAKLEVSGDWREEQAYRKRNGRPIIVGYQITAGKICSLAVPYHRRLS